MGRAVTVTRETWEKVNPANKALLDKFASYQRRVQKSDATIAIYRVDLKVAFAWCLEHNDNKFFVDWTREDVARYLAWLRATKEKNLPHARRRKMALSSLANFVENMLDEEYPNFRNLVRGEKTPEPEVARARVVWRPGEINGLLRDLVEKGAYEKACFLALAMYSGRRVTEMRLLRVSDFDEEHLICGGALYRSSPVRAKLGDGWRQVYCYTLARKFKPYLDLWMRAREEKNIQSEWLFPRAREPRQYILPTTARAWEDVYTRMIGKPCTVRSLRSYFVALLERAGIPDNVIHLMLTHEESAGEGASSQIERAFARGGEKSDR